ncbi:MAG TPA: putative lipid II flippase FtsW [Mycobacteriales bacterium]|nr:putative lipid II flippase FtsW [Mycobacteriales bacterium]
MSAVPTETGSPKLPPLQRPLASYYLLLASAGLLLFLGLVMVFSASNVRSYATYGSSSAIAINQATYIAIGLPMAIVASRMPVRFWRWIACPALIGVVLLLVLVLLPGVGRNVDGATRWIPLPGGLNLQPSELAKLALALWGADLLARKHRLLGDWRHLLVPLVPVAFLLAGLIMLEPDMGTTMALLAVLAALLWVAGTPLRYFAGFMGVLVTASVFLAVAEPYRMARVTAFLDPFANAQGSGYQAVQGLYAISSGGLLGVGLGGSQSKWSGGLPNAHTDFIFAIIAEELGLIGSLSVLVLIATMTYAGVRIAKRTRDPFVRLAASAVTCWLAAQSVINIGGVVGLLPITGIPLPLMSFGGSAMLPTLVAVGMLLSFARAEPGAEAALRARPGLLRRVRSRGAPQVAPRTPGRTGSRVPAVAPRPRAASAPARGRRPAGRR